MYYVLDLDTILIIADASGLNLRLEGYAEVVLSSNGSKNIRLEIDLDPNTTTEIQDALSSKTLILEKTASENISALKLVYLDSSSSVSLANNTSELQGTVAGVAINSATAGNTVKILVFGIAEDSFFNYNINERLFLGINGEITATQPSSGVLTSIGFGLGAGAIQIGIDKPVLL